MFNIAGALPFSIAPAIAPAILAIGGGSYGVLYAVAGVCAIARRRRHPARAARPLSTHIGRRRAQPQAPARPGSPQGPGRAGGDQMVASW